MSDPKIKQPQPFFLDVMTGIVRERYRQIEKHGLGRKRPDGTRAELIPLLEQVRDLCSAKTDEQEETWAEVLAEEFLEVVTEPDKDKLEKELIHLATVAAAWAATLRARKR